MCLNVVLHSTTTANLLNWPIQNWIIMIHWIFVSIMKFFNSVSPYSLYTKHTNCIYANRMLEDVMLMLLTFIRPIGSMHRSRSDIRRTDQIHRRNMYIILHMTFIGLTLDEQFSINCLFALNAANLTMILVGKSPELNPKIILTYFMKCWKVIREEQQNIKTMRKSPQTHKILYVCV